MTSTCGARSCIAAVLTCCRSLSGNRTCNARSATHGSIGGRWPPSRNDALAHGVENQLGSAVQVQLFQDIAAVCLDGVQAQPKQRRHFLVGLALGEQLKNFPL